MNRISIFRKWSEFAFIAAFVAAFLTLAPIGSASAQETPSQVIRSTADKVLAVLQDDALSPEEKRERIEGIVVDDVDFDTVSRLVLARHWRTLSETQQDEFIREFKRHLSVTYGQNVEHYENERIEVVGDREQARGDHTVHTKVARRNAGDVSMDYRLRQIDGEWKIIDVTIEGVSLVSNFRSQFQDIMASGGFERLIRLLRQKNERGEPLEAAPSA